MLDQGGPRSEQHQPGPGPLPRPIHEAIGEVHHAEQEDPGQDIVTDKRRVGEEQEHRHRKQKGQPGREAPPAYPGEHQVHREQVKTVQKGHGEVVRPHLQGMQAGGSLDHLRRDQEKTHQGPARRLVALGFAEEVIGIQHGVVSVVVFQFHPGRGGKQPADEQEEQPPLEPGEHLLGRDRHDHQGVDGWECFSILQRKISQNQVHKSTHGVGFTQKDLWGVRRSGSASPRPLQTPRSRYATRKPGRS